MGHFNRGPLVRHISLQLTVLAPGKMVQFLLLGVAELVSLLLLVPSINAKGHVDCCPAKQITAPDGFTSYFRLVQRSPTVPSVCKNSCTYQMDGNPGRRFCFAPNNAFKSECVHPTTHDFSAVIKFINTICPGW